MRMFSIKLTVNEMELQWHDPLNNSNLFSILLDFVIHPLNSRKIPIIRDVWFYHYHHGFFQWTTFIENYTILDRHVVMVNTKYYQYRREPYVVSFFRIHYSIFLFSLFSSLVFCYILSNKASVKWEYSIPISTWFISKAWSTNPKRRILTRIT